MKKRLYALIILAALPGIVLFPLAPFSFLLTDGEGRIPGLAHEHAFMILLPAYALSLALCIPLSLRARRCAFLIAAMPLLFLLLLAWVFIAGGVRLR